jgi:NAD(P)-dependent dehydrogenase (short-subunit alcohol dehydrogenase family)
VCSQRERRADGNREVPPLGPEFGLAALNVDADKTPCLKTRHPHDSYELADKVVLITGGLGSATARALLARGARVGIVDLHPNTPETAARISPSGVAGFTADVCDRDALDDALARICERFGRIDVVIANAGLMGHGSTLRTMPAPAIDKVLAVNVNGAINTVNAAMKQIVANQGQVVLISSVFAFLNGMGGDSLRDEQGRG